MHSIVTKPFGFSALLLAGLALTACQPSAQTSATGSATGVVNGTDGVAGDVAPSGLAESVVFIETATRDASGKLDGNAAICTGTLINARVVLSAGHCIPAGAQPADIAVALHVVDITAKPRPANVTIFHGAAFQVNPGYNDDPSKSNQEDDMSLIVLDKAVDASTRIATLPAAGFDIASLTKLTAIGYGQSNDQHSATQDNEGVGQLRYTSFNDFQLLPATAEIPVSLQGMIAVSAETTSVCHGDSGGPLMGTNNTIVGVNDAVFPNYPGQQGEDYKAAQQKATEAAMNAFYKKYPDAEICLGGLNVFVNVAPQVGWITSTMNQLLAATH